MHSVWFLQWKWYSCCSEIQVIIGRPQSSTSKHLSKCTQFWKELSSFLRVNKECGQPQLGEGNALNLGHLSPHIGVSSISERTNIAHTEWWRILHKDSSYLYYNCLYWNIVPAMHNCLHGYKKDYKFWHAVHTYGSNQATAILDFQCYGNF